ncbi:MAG: response regulator transcription factor [Chitinophagaceae bacterium]|nr:MAG: response regulator transcription factor [Chitinophagaceae bacterium]
MIRTIIIEDEPGSRDMLAMMLKRHADDIEIIDSCSNPTDGIISIGKNRPDLVFLDIQMPKMTGFEMLKKIDPIDFEVIFTTAYDQYAINAIRISALDYLLKPIDGEDLAAAIEKYKKRQSVNKPGQQFENLFNNLLNKNPLDKTLALSASDGISFIKMSDILRVEANGRYAKFHLLSKETILVSKTLGDYEEILSANQFYRIHDSSIINLNHVKKYIRGDGGTVILSDNTELDVARRRKEEFMKLIPKV